MNILGMLAAGPKAFRGEGVNHENERFVGVLKVEAFKNGRVVMLSYSAKLRIELSYTASPRCSEPGQMESFVCGQ